MKLFAGLNSTDYQDILRAVGLYVDELRLRSVRVLEVDNGILIQGLPDGQVPATGSAFDTLLLTDDDLREILLQAYKRRQSGVRPAVPPTPEA